MQRLYVHLAYRRSGIGCRLAYALLEGAQNYSRLVTVNAAPASTAFWESLGFAPDASDGLTHVQHLDNRRRS
jgi:hypothetical protein